MLKRGSWPALFHALAVVAAASVHPAAAVVGPSTSFGDHSHVVMVLNRLGPVAGFCTGIVVAQDVVMTAAHCVPKGSDVRVHYPAADTEPVMLPVIGVALHLDYRPNAIKTRERSIDLALIHLEKPLPSIFQPASIARTAGATLGARFVITGFGVGREGDAPSSGTLRSATLTTRAPLSSVLLWSEDPDGQGTGACTGDSGGPVSAEGAAEVSAVVVWSAGPVHHQCGTLTQSVWLAPERAWIEHVLAAWRSKGADVLKNTEAFPSLPPAVR